MKRKFEKIFAFTLLKIISPFSPRQGTKIWIFFLTRWGVIFTGKPNYISSKVWFDGTNYELISIGKEVTISSYIRILTHDWSLHTVAKSFDIPQSKPLGKIAGVKIGDYSFIGTGSIIMPGCTIGKGCIIAAGSVVRGCIEDYTIVGGSPAQKIGSTINFIQKYVKDPNQNIFKK